MGCNGHDRGVRSGCAACRYVSLVFLNTPPQVVVTDRELIVPKGQFSKTELNFRLAEIEVSVFHLGIVSQLQIKHGRRKVLLTSAMSPSDEQFEQLCDHVA